MTMMTMMVVVKLNLIISDTRIACRFANNIVANVNADGCDCGLRSSQHAGPCAPTNPDEGTCSSFSALRNIVHVANGSAVCVVTPTKPMDNMTLDDNLYWSVVNHSNIVFPPVDDTFAEWKARGKDRDSRIADPLFHCGAECDFSKLAPNSPAWALGFQPIDVSSVGPRFPTP
jgi:hypothetical protein